MSTFHLSSLATLVIHEAGSGDAISTNSEFS